MNQPEAQAREGDMMLPQGVVLRDFAWRSDARGELCEIYRDDAAGAERLRQWNFSRCAGNSLRGVHLHLVHTDYIVVIEGDFVFGLRDLRPEQPSHGRVVMLRLSGRSLQALQIPPGIAHGFYCAAAGSVVYGLTHRWDAGDDLGCRWDDPGLGLQFPASAPALSERDAAAGSFRDLVREYDSWRRK